MPVAESMAALRDIAGLHHGRWRAGFVLRDAQDALNEVEGREARPAGTRLHLTKSSETLQNRRRVSLTKLGRPLSNIKVEAFYMHQVRVLIGVVCTLLCRLLLPGA